MNPRIIDQGDPRWAELGYRTLPYTVKAEGCGLCAVTMCAMELSQYWDYTPKDTIGFMRQYATNGNGTEWAGIDAGLDKYVGNHMRHYTMSSFWEEVKKGDVIEIKEEKRSGARYAGILETTGGRAVPGWLECDQENLKGTVLELPTREEIDVPVNETMIVELYSK